jgi:hypothetical protein
MGAAVEGCWFSVQQFVKAPWWWWLFFLHILQQKTWFGFWISEEGILCQWF